MIELKEISTEEAQKLNNESCSSYWAIPIALTVILLPVTLGLNWLFNAPWSVYWWISGGLFAIFTAVRLILGKQPQLTAGMVKIIRQGEVIDVVHKGNHPSPKRLNLGQHTDITLAPEPIPSGYPEQHTFTIYQTLGMPYYKQGGTIRYRKEHLIGNEVEIEYLADSGAVIAYRELNPASNPPTVYVRWGSIQLSGKKTILNQNRVDFVVLAADPYGNNGIFLRSDSMRDELFVPLFAKNLNRLEEWLFTLDGFDRKLYTDVSESTLAEEKLIWERRVKKGVSYKSAYAGERVSLLLGSIHVYRDNGHNESIGTKEIDYISLNSLCTDKPNPEFFINLCSFYQSGISLQSRAEGFSKLERWITQMPGFDTAKYLATKATVGEEAKVIWLRDPVGNARLQDTDHAAQAVGELAQGIFLENRDRWLNWGTFRDLSRIDTKNWIAMKKTRYPNSGVRGYTYVIKKPVILGGLELESLQTETPFWWPGQKFNPEWPVTVYWANVAFGNGGLHDFERLKLHITRLIGEPDGHADPAVNGENMTWASWKIDRASLKISTWKPYQLDVYQHACRLEITYDPDVDHLYTDDYTKGLHLHDQIRYLVLEGKLSVARDYTRYPHSRHTPGCIAELIQSEQEYVVWLDEKYAKLGIGNKEYVQILPLADVSGLTLTGSYWRDSPGELQFHVLPKQRIERAMVSSSYLGELSVPQGDRHWSHIRERLENFLRIPCTYSEDRQYY